MSGAEEQSIRLTLRQMRDPAVLVDCRDFVLQANSAFEMLSGWSDKDLAGRSFREILATEANDQALPSPEDPVEDGPGTQLRHLRHRDGRTFWAECITIPLGSDWTPDSSLYVLRPRTAPARRSAALMALIGFVTDQTVWNELDVSSFLDLGCRYFGLELSTFLSADEDRVDIWAGNLSREAGLQDDVRGYRLSMLSNDDYETRILAESGVAVAQLCANDRGQAHQEERISLATCLSCPVGNAHQRHGTLCFLDRKARQKPFDLEERQILQFMASWMASLIDAKAARLRQEEASERLRESEERYRILYERTPAILHSIDDQGRLASVSDAWLATMGYEREDVIGRPSTDFLTSESKRYAEEIVLPAFRESGCCHDIAYQFVTKRGDIKDVVLSAISLRHDDGRFFRSLAVLLDVTERKRVERTLASKTAALERSNADLARFAHVASHDLQEPLRRIIGYCAILKDDHGPELSDEALKTAGIIQSGSWQLRLIINDLLAYIRVKEQLDRAFEPVDLAAVLHHALDDLNDEISKSGARVTVEHLPLVWGRAPILKMVFHHLLANAIRHGSEQAPAIVVAVEDAGDVWRLSVSDRGKGVEPRFADRIFEIFERLHHKDDSRGSGTGLAICRLIVQRCGGDIWLDRDYEPGARFVFTLPKERPDIAHSSAIDGLVSLCSPSFARA